MQNSMNVLITKVSLRKQHWTLNKRHSFIRGYPAKVCEDIPPHYSQNKEKRYDKAKAYIIFYHNSAKNRFR